jgi:hypothetical protein
MLSNIMLSVIMLSVVMQSVVAPLKNKVIPKKVSSSRSYNFYLKYLYSISFKLDHFSFMSNIEL